jgi:hypothetical protein
MSRRLEIIRYLVVEHQHSLCLSLRQHEPHGRTWVASITISVHNGSHGPVGGATVTGRFSAGAKGTGSCITDASGSCFITKSRLRGTSVTFTVTGVTHPARTYQGASNHDPDGGNGTVITVLRP